MPVGPVVVADLYATSSRSLPLMVYVAPFRTNSLMSCLRRILQVFCRPIAFLATPCIASASVLRVLSWLLGPASQSEIMARLRWSDPSMTTIYARPNPEAPSHKPWALVFLRPLLLVCLASTRIMLLLVCTRLALVSIPSLVPHLPVLCPVCFL